MMLLSFVFSASDGHSKEAAEPCRDPSILVVNRVNSTDANLLGITETIAMPTEDANNETEIIVFITELLKLKKSACKL